MKRKASSIKKAALVCKRGDGWQIAQALVIIACALLLLKVPLRVWGDQVEMQNGDRYAGHVLSLNTNTVVLKSDVLGTLRLPRSRVAIITLGPNTTTNSPALTLPTSGFTPAASATSAGAISNQSPALPGLSTSTNLIQQVQKQFLAGAGPEANNKFNELLGGLMSGKLSVEDIRAEAKTAAEQLRALQRESGEDAGFAASTYLAILDHFLKETAPSSPTTNGPVASPKSRPAPSQPDE
jgi:hypothetical protein